MSYSVDANLLLYASDRSSPHRAAAARFLESRAEDPDLAEDEGFLDIYRAVTERAPVRGNLVPDAHLGGLLRQHGVGTLYTADSDFRRFDFLKLRNPLGPS